MLVDSATTKGTPMADKPPVLHEYDVEIRPGVTTTMQLNDADAERMGVKKTDDDTKSRSVPNKARTPDNK